MPCKQLPKRAGMDILISDKRDFKTKFFTKGHFIIMSQSIRKTYLL